MDRLKSSIRAGWDVSASACRSAPSGRRGSSAHGASATVDYSHEFIPLVNTSNEVAAAVSAATAVVGIERVDSSCSLVTASEDFAQYLQAVPGCFLDIGNGVDGAHGNTLHNSGYDFNDEILTIGADFWVRLVEEQLPTA